MYCIQQQYDDERAVALLRHNWLLWCRKEEGAAGCLRYLPLCVVVGGFWCPTHDSLGARAAALLWSIWYYSTVWWLSRARVSKRWSGSVCPLSWNVIAQKAHIRKSISSFEIYPVVLGPWY